MIDRDQLREAIALREQGSGVVGMYEAGELVLEAARLVATGEESVSQVHLDADYGMSCLQVLPGRYLIIRLDDK